MPAAKDDARSQISVEIDDGGRVRRVTNPAQKFIRLWEDCEQKVHIDLVYVRYIAAVDTVQQTFEIAMGLEMSWLASEGDIARYKKNKFDFVPDFVPNYEFPNAKSEDRETRAHQDGARYKIIKDKGESYVCMRPLVYLTCMERFELQSFPFDVQELTVTMDTPFYDMSVKKTMYVPPRKAFHIDRDAPKDVDVVQDGEMLDGKLVILNRAFSAIPQFRARRVVIEFAARSDPGEEDDEDAYQYGQLVIRFQLERRYEGYLWRIALLSILLAVTALTCFALDYTQFAERQALLMTLILASVAFQYVVQSELPAVPYVVLLEKLTIATFVSNILLLCLVSLLSSTVISSDPEWRKRMDVCLAVGYVVVLFACVVGFFFYGLYRRRVELHKLDMGSIDLRNANYLAKEDSAINVTGLGMLPESRTLPVRGQNGFLSFSGSDKKLD